MLYEPLPPYCIRLLKLEDCIDGVPHCSLTSFPCNAAPAYIALSYTWGPPEEPKFGRPLGSEFYVHARRRTMISTKPKGSQLYGDWLWIDALCINQKDKKEKSEQVNRMANVYESAEWVLIWLGQSYTTTGRVLQMFLGMWELVRDGKVAEMLSTVEDFENAALPNLRLRGSDQPEEVILSAKSKYLCGQFWLPEEHVQAVTIVMKDTNLSAWLKYHGADEGFESEAVLAPTPTHEVFWDLIDGNPRREAWSSLEIWYNVPDPLRNAGALLDYFLFATDYYQCYEPVDQVFACLGMVKRSLQRSHGQALPMHANYTKSVVEVYTEAMTFILSSTGCLTPLLRSRTSGRWQCELPSWVPNFEAYGWKDLLGKDLTDAKRVQNPRYVPYNASRDAVVGFGIRGTLLLVHHHPYATVTHVGELWNEITRGFRFERTAELMLARLKKLPSVGARIRDLLTTICWSSIHSPDLERDSSSEMWAAFRAFVTLLTACWISTSRRHGRDHATILSQLKWQRYLAELNETATIPLPATIFVEVERDHDGYIRGLGRQKQLFEQTAHKTSPGRRVFLLDNGELGLGQENLRAGDVLYIVADGGRCPVLLRRKESQYRSSWSWIGEASVDGIMYGEAVTQMDRESEIWQEAIII